MVIADLIDVALLVVLTFPFCVCSRNSSNTSSFKKNKGKMVDTTQLIEAFQFTESAGTVNALYGLLLHQGVPSRGLTKPPQLLDNATSFTQAALQLLHRLALLDLSVFQVGDYFAHPQMDSRHDHLFYLLPASAFAAYSRSRRSFIRVPPHFKLSSVVCSSLAFSYTPAALDYPLHRLFRRSSPR